MKPPIIFIPARLASTRLPHKPLAMIGDAPMIVQVWRRAMEAVEMLDAGYKKEKSHPIEDTSPPGKARREADKITSAIEESPLRASARREAWGFGAKPQTNIRIIIACDSDEIASVIRAAGGEAVLTDPALPSGSDRIWQALQQIDPAGEHEIIINLQGDMPTLDPRVIGAVLAPLENPAVDIATLAAEIHDEAEKTNPAVVKIAMAYPLSGKSAPTQASQVGRASLEHEQSEQPMGFSGENTGAINTSKALYFSRATIPYGDGPLYHHIGIYAYRRAALERFVSLPPSPLEQREKLEQLRALEAGMRIDVALVDTVPLGVDTPEQLEQARKIIESQEGSL